MDQNKRDMVFGQKVRQYQTVFGAFGQACELLSSINPLIWQVHVIDEKDTIIIEGGKERYFKAIKECRGILEGLEKMLEDPTVK